MKIIAILFTCVLLCACSSSNDAHKALSAMGFTEIQTTGYRFFGCSDDDTFKTGFQAKNPQGQVVTGVVCSDWFKGSTVRFD
jgi:hypothetical protein